MRKVIFVCDRCGERLTFDVRERQVMGMQVSPISIQQFEKWEIPQTATVKCIELCCKCRIDFERWMAKEG